MLSSKEDILLPSNLQRSCCMGVWVAFHAQIQFDKHVILFRFFLNFTENNVFWMLKCFTTSKTFFPRGKMNLHVTILYKLFTSNKPNYALKLYTSICVICQDIEFWISISTGSCVCWNKTLQCIIIILSAII